MPGTNTVAVALAPSRRRLYLAHALVATAILLCAGLVAYPPDRTAFYPLCPAYQYFGIFCPGCGATRALAALLHGRCADAMRLNAFFVLLLPALLAGALESYRRALQPGRFRWPQPPAGALYATLAAAAFFTVARNLL
jgi:Protein of unknown function (DUF2752)